MHTTAKKNLKKFKLHKIAVLDSERQGAQTLHASHFFKEKNNRFKGPKGLAFWKPVYLWFNQNQNTLSYWQDGS